MKWPFITVTEMTQNKISPHLIKYIQGNTGHFLEYSKIQHNQRYKQEKTSFKCVSDDSRILQDSADLTKLFNNKLILI